MSCALSYNLSVTGDCGNAGLGAYTIEIYGSAPDYSIQELYPGTGVSGYTFVGTGSVVPPGPNNYYPNVPVNGGSGTLASFNVTKINTTYNLNLSTPGTNYQVGDILTILGTNVGGATPANDITITVISLQPSDIVPLGIGVTTYTQTNLYAGTYTINLIDSCLPINNVYTIDIYISSGTSVSITGIRDTLCDLPNGAITAETSNYYGLATFSLYEQDGTYVTSGTLISDTYVFNDVEGGYYYVIGDDGGGCTGQSATFLVKSSITVDYGFYVVNNAGCSVDNAGAIYITGLTGTPPYTYLWSNGETTQNITGITSGSYSVQVEDSTGCIKTLGATVIDVEPVSFGSFDLTPPSCFVGDGEITVNVIGGTPPYSYLGSNGVNGISFAQSYTFTGLGSGNFTVTVTDAGLCTFTQSITLLTPNSFTLVSFNTTNSFCNDSSGKVVISLVGGTAPYNFKITDSSGNTYNQTSMTTPNATFSGLKSGIYSIEIEDSGIGTCVYNSTFTINNTSKFGLSATTVGSACNSSEGEVTLNISTGGTQPYTYEINDQFAIFTGLSYTFTGLTPGNYSATVTDSTNCGQNVNFSILSTSSIDFNLVSTPADLGGNGTITAFITEGTPPFTLDWSPNVNGQTGITVTNLTAGTYSLEVTDSIGCNKTEVIFVNGLNNVEQYEVFSICDSNFDNNGFVLVKGPKSLLLEGFNDLTFADTDCIINETIFIAQTNINGIIKEKYIFTGDSVTDYPSNELWYSAITELLISYDGIDTVIIDPENNTIEVKTDCENISANLGGAQVIINMVIKYLISCYACATNYLVQNCCPELQLWELPGGGADTDFSDAIPLDCFSTSVVIDSTINYIRTKYCLSGLTFDDNWELQTQTYGNKGVVSLFDIEGLYIYIIEKCDSTLGVYFYDQMSDVMYYPDNCCSDLTYPLSTLITNTTIDSNSYLPNCNGPFTGTGLLDWYNRIIDLSGDSPDLKIYSYYDSGLGECMVSGITPNTEVVTIDDQYEVDGKIIADTDYNCYEVISAVTSTATIIWEEGEIYDDCSEC